MAEDFDLQETLAARPVPFRLDESNSCGRWILHPAFSTECRHRLIEIVHQQSDNAILGSSGRVVENGNLIEHPSIEKVVVSHSLLTSVLRDRSGWVPVLYFV